MAVPKKKLTKSRIGKRRSQGHGKMTKSVPSKCQTSSLPVPPHRMRADVGFYKGKKIKPQLMK